MLNLEGIPVVYVDRKPPVNQYGTVVVSNNFEAAQQAVQHLFKGFSKVGVISVHSAPSSIAERVNGYLAVCEALNVQPILALADGWGEEVGYQQMKQLLERLSTPFGIFCVTNAITRGAFRYLQEQEISIPDEVGLVGFDDSAWMTLVKPQITVVRTHPVRIGETAVERLMDMFNGETEPSKDIIPAELVIRQSSKEG